MAEAAACLSAGLTTAAAGAGLSFELAAGAGWYAAAAAGAAFSFALAAGAGWTAAAGAFFSFALAAGAGWAAAAGAGCAGKACRKRNFSYENIPTNY